MSETRSDAIENFIARWQKAEAAERANYQMFLTELCDLLELPHPDPACPELVEWAGADNAFNRYVFDRAITRQKPDGSETTVWADLGRDACPQASAHASESPETSTAFTDTKPSSPSRTLRAHVPTKRNH
jgi:hypothetical protein